MFSMALVRRICLTISNFSLLGDQAILSESLFCCKLLLKVVSDFHFQEKLDFAMNDIIFDLLSIGRNSRQISPEVRSVIHLNYFVR